MTRQEKYHSDLLGSSVPVVELRHIIKQVAPTNVTVLITGESGVGKEIVAKEIYRLSKRNQKQFVTVNCGAIPEGLIESELFGHMKGSFTGATDTRKGYFEIADGGTIFLDEIGELPLQTQVKFLRVIENGEYSKVGSSRSEKVNVRIIAATNKNLEQQIGSGHFREDLYYRLRSINIYIPPLRERSEDIPDLFQHFVKEFSEKNLLTFEGIESDALDFMINYNWPGNIRQLKNFTESIITLVSDRKINRDDVVKHLNVYSTKTTLPAPVSFFKEKDEKQLLLRALFELKTDIMDVKEQLSRIDFDKLSKYDENHEGFYIDAGKLEEYDLEDIEKEVLKFYWKKYHGNMIKISNKLKISTRTLYRKYKQLGIREEIKFS